MGKPYDDIKIDGYSDDEIAYHLQLCGQANLVKSYGQGLILCWDGHEWLANRRMAKAGITVESLIEEIKTKSCDPDRR